MLTVTWRADYVILPVAGATMFTITDEKLYIAKVTLSTEYNANFIP